MVSLRGPLAAFLSTSTTTAALALRPLTRRNVVVTAAFLGSVSSQSRPSRSAFAFAQDQPLCPSEESSSTKTTSCLSSSALSQQQQQRRSTTSLSSSINMAEIGSTGYMEAKAASALDQELMSEPGFSLEQLMELAGLSVAEAVYQVLEDQQQQKKKPRVLLVCGPGNNGGDGLVAARHLVMFGMDCAIVYPKRSNKQHFINLMKQCEDVGIPFLDAMPPSTPNSYDVIVDAIFGFSFHDEPREPFATILKQIQQAKEQNKDRVQVVAVDVPSGWNVDGTSKTDFTPDVLISLTAPKLCAKQFPGRHFVGGRFLPPALGDKYGLSMPNYPGVAQVVEVSSSTTKRD